MRTSWVFMSVTLTAPTDSETCAGSAGRAKDTLVAQGYTVTSATNAVDVLDITAVYYREGMDAAAADVAAVLGVRFLIAKSVTVE